MYVYIVAFKHELEILKVFDVQEILIDSQRLRLTLSDYPMHKIKKNENNSRSGEDFSLSTYKNSEISQQEVFFIS